MIQARSRKTNLKRIELRKIEAGGGILYKTVEGQFQILLIKRNGVWDLPKGKKEDAESIRECSSREVTEEVGVHGVKIDLFLCNTYHEYQESGELIGKTTAWYAMQPTNTSESLQPQTNEGITELRWVKVDEGLQKVGYQNLKDVIHEFQKKIMK